MASARPRKTAKAVRNESAGAEGSAGPRLELVAEHLDANGSCFHGGASFDAIGTSFTELARRHEVVAADVLDAWFPPAPRVLEALGDDPSWLARTSPPVDADGLRAAIARERGVPESCVACGAGSSALIFAAFQQLLRKGDRVVLLDPTYGEYAHVCGLVGCEVERLVLRRSDGYRLDLDELASRLAPGPRLVVLVNPNNPTGRAVPAADLGAVLARAGERTLVWVDEAYSEYAGPGTSLERWAAASPNAIVCKSMSKVYALSGMRVAYLCGAEALVRAVRRWLPPWAVALPAQVAALRALQESGYYAARWRETHALRAQLAAALNTACPRLDVAPGSTINALLCHLPDDGPAAPDVVARCRRQDVFLRHFRGTGAGGALGDRALRIAVKDAAAQARLLEVFGEALGAERS